MTQALPADARQRLRADLAACATALGSARSEP